MCEHCEQGFNSKVSKREFLKLSLLSLSSFLFLPYQKIFSSENIYNGPIFDAHAHVGEKNNLEKIINNFKKVGIERAMLFVELKDVDVIKKKVGKNFYLFADAFKNSKKDNKYKLRNDRFSTLKKHLKNKNISGVGEFYSLLSIHPSKSPIRTDLFNNEFKNYLKYLNSKKVIFHIHDELMDKKRQSIFAKYPNVQFILAHCGYRDPDELETILKTNNNVFTDLSLVSNNHFGPSKKWGGPKVAINLSKEWREILIKYSDRFLVGSDISKRRADQLQRVISDYRKLLGNLPIETAEKIAFKNFEKLIS